MVRVTRRAAGFAFRDTPAPTRFASRAPRTVSWSQDLSAHAQLAYRPHRFCCDRRRWRYPVRARLSPAPRADGVAFCRLWRGEWLDDQADVLHDLRGDDCPVRSG